MSVSSCPAPPPRQRWVTLLGCVFLMLTAGSVYFFSAYSADLAVAMNYDNTQLNIVGTAGNVGIWFNVHGGYFCDKFGPGKTCLIAAAMNVVGFCSLGLACFGVFSQSHWFAAVCVALFCQAAGTAYIAALKSAMTSFHISERGTVVGGLVCYLALSAGLESQTYRAILREPIMSLGHGFFVMGLLLAVVQVACSLLVDHPTEPDRPMLSVELRRVQTVIGGALVLSIALLITAVITLSDVSHFTQITLWAVLMALVATLGFLLRVWNRYFPLPAEIPCCLHDTAMAAVSVASVDEEVPATAGMSPVELSMANNDTTFLSSSSAASSSGSQPLVRPGVSKSQPCCGAATLSRPAAQDTASTSSMTVLQGMKTLNFWLLSVGLFTMLGYGITLINNIGTFVASLEPVASGTRLQQSNPGMERRTGTLVALFAIFSAWGRLGIGALADRFAEKCPRSSWLVVSSVLMLLSNVVTVASMSFGGLCAAVPLAGLAVGCVFSMSPVVVSELFGMAHYGTFWALFTIASAVATIVLSILLAGAVSDAHSMDEYYFVKEQRFCLGAPCYRLTFELTLVVCGAAILVTGLLAWRLYNQHRLHRGNYE